MAAYDNLILFDTRIYERTTEDSVPWYNEKFLKFKGKKSFTYTRGNGAAVLAEMRSYFLSEWQLLNTTDEIDNSFKIFWKKSKGKCSTFAVLTADSAKFVCEMPPEKSPLNISAVFGLEEASLGAVRMTQQPEHHVFDGPDETPNKRRAASALGADVDRYRAKISKPSLPDNSVGRAGTSESTSGNNPDLYTSAMIYSNSRQKLISPLSESDESDDHSCADDQSDNCASPSLSPSDVHIKPVPRGFPPNFSDDLPPPPPPHVTPLPAGTVHVGSGHNQSQPAEAFGNPLSMANSVLLQRIPEDVIAELKAHIARLETQLSAKETEYYTLHDRFVSMNTQLDIANAETDRLKDQLTQTQTETDRAPNVQLYRCVGCGRQVDRRDDGSVSFADMAISFKFSESDIWPVDEVLRSTAEMARIVDKMQNNPGGSWESSNQYRLDMQKVLANWLRGKLSNEVCKVPPPKLKHENPRRPTLEEVCKLAFSLITVIPWYKDHSTPLGFEYLCDPKGKYGMLKDCFDSGRVKKARVCANNHADENDDEREFQMPDSITIATMDDLPMPVNQTIVDAGIPQALYDQLVKHCAVHAHVKDRFEASRVRALFVYCTKLRLNEIYSENMSLAKAMRRFPIYQTHPTLLRNDFYFYMRHHCKKWNHTENDRFMEDTLVKNMKYLLMFVLRKAFYTVGREQALFVAFRNDLQLKFNFGIEDFNAGHHEGDLLDNEAFIIGCDGLMSFLAKGTNQHKYMFQSVFVSFKDCSPIEAIEAHRDRIWEEAENIGKDMAQKMLATARTAHFQKLQSKQNQRKGNGVLKQKPPTELTPEQKAVVDAKTAELKSIQPYILVRTASGKLARRKMQENKMTYYAKMEVEALYIVLEDTVIEITKSKGETAPSLRKAFFFLYYATYTFGVQFSPHARLFFDYFNQIFEISPGKAYDKLNSTTGNYPKAQEIRLYVQNKMLLDEDAIFVSDTRLGNRQK